MQHPAFRWSVLAVAIVAAGGVCYWAATLERQALDQRRALATATTDARALQGALSDARRALAAMASPGQAAVSWSRQATASIETARGKLTALMSTEGGAHLRNHAERLDRLAEAQTRLHDFAVGGRALMASDVAFGEALPHVDALDQQVGDTLATMIATADRGIAAVRDRQILAFASALGVLGIAAVLLTPLPRRSEVEAADVPVAVTPVADADLSLAPPVLATPPPLLIPEARVADRARVDPVPRVDLLPLASACQSLARLSEGAALPSVLDVMRPALGARGVAVWQADADRTSLHVVASSGYDLRVVERFPILSASDDTPTSQAFARGAAVRTPARASQPAGVAVPITGARGTTGVLSFELAGDRDASPEVMAAAAIVAAQLAALIEPQPRPVADAPVAQANG